MTPLIRRAVPEDVPVLTQIEFECFPDPTWTATDFLQCSCWVAELEHRVVGFVILHQIFPGDNLGAPECEILNLAVVPVARNLGIATALLQHVFVPGTRYFLEARESNQAARNLYKKLGFTEIGSRENYYDNPTETAIVMTKK